MNNKSYLLSLILLASIFIMSCGNDESSNFNPNLGNAPVDPNKQILADLINDLRENGHQCNGTQMPAVPILLFNEKLNEAAQNHANYMNSIDELTHAGDGNSSFTDRATAVGYSHTALAENLAKGYADEASVVDAWKNSDGHCENIMNANVREMGVGTSGAYWVMVYGVE